MSATTNPPATLVRQYPPLLTKKQVASDFYSVSERTIDRWLNDGTLPSDAKVMIGGSVRFRTRVLLEHAANLDAANENGGAN